MKKRALQIKLGGDEQTQEASPVAMVGAQVRPQGQVKRRIRRNVVSEMDGVVAECPVRPTPLLAIGS